MGGFGVNEVHRRSVVFTAPGCVDVHTEPLPDPAPDQVLVQTLVSAISAGTELLFFRGQVPPDMPLDATIEALAGPVQYPLRYGYACVGRVVKVGEQVDGRWQGRLVFAFHPHTSHFCLPPAQLLPLPTGVEPEQASLLPNMETAVNLVLDGAPLLGERVVVFGQGVVGLLTTGLLSRFPLLEVVAVDPLPMRRRLAQALGAQAAYAPGELPQAPLGVDLVYELSGNPQALDQAMDHAGFAGRIVVGSWYGTKTASLALGGRFHRARLRLISSQVSTLAPGLTGRWDKTRRLDVAWRALATLPTEQLVTHRFPVEQAAAAYEQIAHHPEETLQVLITY